MNSKINISMNLKTENSIKIPKNLEKSKYHSKNRLNHFKPDNMHVIIFMKINVSNTWY